MQRIKTFASAALLMLILDGCSYIQGKDEVGVYQSGAKHVPAIALPEHLSREKMEDYYPLPHLNKPLPVTKVSIVPPGSSLEKAAVTQKK